MVAEQTAAYQKQMWLSQLQVTNPQAYQVTLRFISRIILNEDSSSIEFFQTISLSRLLLSWSPCPKG